MNIKNKWLLYNYSLQPIVTYASFVWSASAKNNLLRFKSQNFVIRQNYSIPFEVSNKHFYWEIPTPRLDMYFRKLNKNFHLALQNNISPVLNNFENYDQTAIIEEEKPKTDLCINLLLWTYLFNFYLFFSQRQAFLLHYFAVIWLAWYFHILFSTHFIGRWFSKLHYLQCKLKHSISLLI